MTVPSRLPNDAPQPTDTVPVSAADVSPAAPPPEAGPAPAPPPPVQHHYISGIITSGLAAICGALFTSWAGVQGTIIGAVIGATIGSGISEVVRQPLDALELRIVQAGVSARRLRRDGLMKTVFSSSAAADATVRFMASRGAVVTIGTVAIVGFLLAITGITAVEAARGEPLAAIVSDSEATGTTVGHVMPNPLPALAPAPTLPATTTPAAASPAPANGAAGASAANSNSTDEQPGAPVGGSPVVTGTSATAVENQNSAAQPALSPEASGTQTPAESTADGTPGTSGTGTPSASLTATTSGSATAGALTTAATAAPATSAAQAATATAQAGTATAQAATATAQIVTTTVQASAATPSTAAPATRGASAPATATQANGPTPGPTSAATARPGAATTPPGEPTSGNGTGAPLTSP